MISDASWPLGGMSDAETRKGTLDIYTLCKFSSLSDTYQLQYNKKKRINEFHICFVVVFCS